MNGKYLGYYRGHGTKSFAEKGGNRSKKVPLKQYFDRKQFSRKTNPQKSAVLALRGRKIEPLNLRRNTFDPLPQIFLSYIYALIALKMPSVYPQKEKKKQFFFTFHSVDATTEAKKILQVKHIGWKSLTWLVTLDTQSGTC